MDGLRGIRLEILSQREHERVDRPRGRGPGEPPDLLQQFLAGHHLALVLDEIFEQLHLQARQPHRLALHPHLPGVEVHLGRAEPVDRLGRTTAAVARRAAAVHAGPAGEEVAHHREQLLQVEGLLEIHVGAGVEAADPILDERPGGEHHHRHVVAGGTDGLADGVAAHAREHDVEHDEIEPRSGRFQPLEGRLAVTGHADGMPLRLEVELDAEGEVLFVLDDEDLGHGGETRGTGFRPESYRALTAPPRAGRPSRSRGPRTSPRRPAPCRRAAGTSSRARPGPGGRRSCGRASTSWWPPS